MGEFVRLCLLACVLALTAVLAAAQPSPAPPAEQARKAPFPAQIEVRAPERALNNTVADFTP